MNLNFKKIGEGPAIVVLHGFFGMSDNWISLAKKMSSEYSFYLVDLRNHGKSPHSDVINFDVMSRDVKLLVEKQNLSEITLLGHSMGGKVAMYFALKYPQLLNKLVVVDIALKKYKSPYFAMLIQALLAVDLNVQSRKEIENELLSTIKIDPAIVHFFMKNLYRDDNNNFKWLINLHSLRKNIENIMDGFEIDEAIEVDSLFIKGSESDYILAEDALFYSQKFPNSQIVEIKNATHWVHSSAPQNFEKALRNFLI